MNLGGSKLGTGAKLLIVLGAGVAIGVAWYLISPLFITRSVDEAFPTNPPPATETPLSEATAAPGAAAPEATATEDDLLLSEEMSGEEMSEEDMASMQAIVQGEFYNVAHEGMGTATVYQLEDGSRLLRFENFEVLNGPELHVWLVDEDPVPNTVGTLPAVYADLGALKGNVGDQNYSIPENLDLSLYNSVVIWCVPFRVPFSAASLAGS